MARRTALKLVIAAVLALLLVLGTSAHTGSRHHGPPAIAACTGAEAIDFACYKRRYHAMVQADGARAAIRDLNARAQRLGYVRAACHQLMHGIGRDAGRGDGIGAFGQGDDTCSSGFFHGVVESVMARDGPARVVRDARQVCAPFRARDEHGIAHYNCIHGMGHGFMEVFHGDVFRSLAGCSALRGSWERHHCEGGVFMQNLTAVSDPRRRKSNLRPDQPLYPCTAVAARYKHECYMKQTAYALFVRDDDFGAVFRMCAGSPDVAFRDDCQQGLGGDASIRASKYVTGPGARRATVRALCRLGPDRGARRNCVVGAVTVIVRDGASKVANPVAFCASFREADVRAACARAHLKTVQALTREPVLRQDQAASRGDSPRMLCQNAARLEASSTRAPPLHSNRRDLQ